MASKRRNMFYQNKKETTEIGTCNVEMCGFSQHAIQAIGRVTMVGRFRKLKRLAGPDRFWLTLTVSGGLEVTVHITGGGSETMRQLRRELRTQLPPTMVTNRNQFYEEGTTDQGNYNFTNFVMYSTELIEFITFLQGQYTSPVY
ncbi:hypothetical protein AAG570_006785 [Ranatra chinensis]|uniref:Uncharacterized protein n=1 Tax=Ranatra chinensis TaxID=642074 RepID=A0ABD0ZGB4_9HEMI